MNRPNHAQHTFAASSRFVPRTWLLSFGLLGVVVVEPAWGATAGCELDCPLGTTCELAPGSCPALACAEPDDCPPCDAQPTPYCAPAACEDDGDCGDSMRCAEHTTLDCGSAMSVPAVAPAAASDAPRTAPEPVACETSVIRQCTPRWQLPCTADADCGDGFRCEETEACSVPPYDPSAGTPPSSEVTCTPTGTFACVVVVTSCGDDADCPDNFACVEDPNGTCSSSSDGQTQCEPAQLGRVCAPRVVASPATTSGDVATASSNEGGPGDDLGSKLPSSASQGGCALNGSTPGGVLGLLSTLGLGAAFALRRRQAAR